MQASIWFFELPTFVITVQARSEREAYEAFAACRATLVPIVVRIRRCSLAVS